MEQKHLDYLASLGPIRGEYEKPEQPGWYAREWPGHVDGSPWLEARDYWDGKAWYYGDEDGEVHAKAISQCRRWRGLAEPAVVDDEVRPGEVPTLPAGDDTAGPRFEVPRFDLGPYTNDEVPYWTTSKPTDTKRRRYRIASRVLFVIGIALVVAVIAQLAI